MPGKKLHRDCMTRVHNDTTFILRDNTHPQNFLVDMFLAY